MQNLRKVGEGSSGTVYRGEMDDGKQVAIKSMATGKKTDLPAIENEIAMMKLSKHDKVVECAPARLRACTLALSRVRARAAVCDAYRLAEIRRDLWFCFVLRFECTTEQFSGLRIGAARLGSACGPTGGRAGGSG